MSLGASERVISGESEIVPPVFEGAGLRDSLQARFSSEAANETALFDESFYKRKEVADLILEFWQQYEALIGTDARHFYDEAEADLQELQDRKFEVAQIAEKLLRQDIEWRDNDLLMLSLQVRSAILFASKINLARINASIPSTEFTGQYADETPLAQAGGKQLDSERIEDTAQLHRVTEPGRAVVTLPGQNAVNTIETLVPLPAAERAALAVLFEKFDSQILPDMQSLVEKLNDNDQYNTYIESFNAVAQAIYDLEDEIANPELRAPISEYQEMDQHLRALINNADTQYFALLQAYNDETESSVVRAVEHNAESVLEASHDPDVGAANVAIETAEVQLKAIRGVLENVSSVRLDSKQQKKMETIQVLLGDPSNHKSIASSQESLKKAVTQGGDTAGSRELLRNKVEALQQNLAEIGQTLALFMNDADKMLFVVSAPQQADPVEVNRSMDAAPSTVSPLNNITDTKPSPRSLETIAGQSERISDELFALYQAGSHEAIRSAEDIKNNVLEKKVGQVITEIEAALERHGCTDEEIFEFGQDVLVPLGEKIKAAYRIDDDRKRGDTLWDLYDSLLQMTKDELSRPRTAAEETSPAKAETYQEIDRYAEVEQKKAEVISAAAACQSLRNQLADEFDGVTHDQTGLVKVGLRMMDYTVGQVQVLANSFVQEAIAADDFIQKQSVVLEEIRRHATTIEKVATYLRAQFLNQSMSMPVDAVNSNETLDIDLEVLAAEAGVDINLFSLERAGVLDINFGTLSAVEPISVDEYLNRLAITNTFAEEVLYGPLPKTIEEINVRVDTIASEFKRISQISIESIPEKAVITSAIQACLENRAKYKPGSKLPLQALADLINVAEPLIRQYREYKATKTELATIRERESDYDVYKFPVETHALLQNFQSKVKKFQLVKEKIWRLEHEQKQPLPEGIQEGVEKVNRLINGDNSIDAILWVIRSNHEEGKASPEEIKLLSKKLVDLYVAIDFVETLLVPSIVVDAEDSDFGSLGNIIDDSRSLAEILADEQLNLGAIRQKIENLQTTLAAQGVALNPKLERIMRSIDVALANDESDPLVKANNFAIRYKSIIKEWEGEDKKSGVYFALSPEERLMMEGLPATPEESGVRKFEDGDEYAQALASYRSARHEFLGGTRQINEGEVTLDGALEMRNKGLKAEYEEKLQAFYSSLGRVARLKNTFGFKPELTPELEALKKRYSDARLEYARTLQSVLTARSLRLATNKNFDVGSESVKKAFGQKFVLEEFKQQQKIQAEALDGPKNETIQKIMAVMRKHKWTMRGVTVIGAGVIAGGGLAALGLGAAAFSGTAAVVGAGTVAARMTATIGLGAWLGKAVHFKYQKNVDKAEGQVEVSEGNAIRSFSVDQLNELEASLIATADAKASAVRQQKIKTIAAAALPGGLVGAASLINALDSVSTGGISEVREAAMAQQREIEPVNPSQPTMILEKVDFVGKGLNKGVVPEADWLKMRGVAVQKAEDILASRPNLREVEVEQLVMQKLEAEFGTKSWWGDVNLDSVDLTVSKRAPVIPSSLDMSTEAMPIPLSQTAAPGGSVASDTVTSPQPREAASLRIQVEAGDSLSSVALEKFKSSPILSGLSPAEQKAAIYELMKRAQSNAALRETIGLRGDDINKIYIGQDISLNGLESELRGIVSEQAYKAGTAPLRPATGGLKVSSASGEEVGTVPIKIAAQAEDFVTEEVAPVSRPARATGLGAVDGGQNVKVRMDIPEVPRPYSLSGNYLDTREYRAFVTELFGSVEKFNKAVTAEVTQFERGTYDALDRLMGTEVYLSPYKEFSNYTMAEIDAKRAELEYAKKQYDTFGAQVAKNPFGEVGQMKYETYRASVERLEQLKREYSWTPNTKLADFIGRVVAETRARELAEANTLLKA